MNDRISDLARARISDRSRRIGSRVVSAEVVRFIPRPSGRNAAGSTDFPTIAFRSAPGADDRADTAPCEYLATEHDES
jgi:hypothetical protein